MNHISEDNLLKYSLKIIEDNNVLHDIEVHLDSCSDCRAHLSKIQYEIETIGGVKAQGKSNTIISGRQRFSYYYSLIKIAAILIIGIMLGYGIMNWLQPESITVVPSTLVPSPPSDSLLGLAPSDATDIQTE